MEEHIFYDEDCKGFIKAFNETDIEYVDPIEYYSADEINKNISIERDLLFMENPFLANQLTQDFFHKRAVEKWNEKYQEIIKTQVPPIFLTLLKCDSRKEQIKLLKGQSFTPSQLIAFIFKAWTEFGFTFSQYTAEYHHKGLDEKALPKLIYIEGDKVKTVGTTTLTDGQLSNVIEHRKVTVSKFFDNGNNWHCFFLTFNSLKGKESWKSGQAHFHYISNKFGISRDEAVKQLKSEKYPSTPVHIELLEYGNQPNANVKLV